MGIGPRDDKYDGGCDNCCDDAPRELVLPFLRSALKSAGCGNARIVILKFGYITSVTSTSITHL